MRCPPISQHHRRGRRAGAEASRLINETGHAPRIGAGNGALGQTTVHWGRQRPGDPGHAARIGAGNGALGQTNCLLQCLFSCPNAAHRTRGRTAAVVSSHGVRPKRRRRRPDQANGDHQRCRQTASNTRAVGAPFSQRYRDPRGRIRRAVPHSGSVFTAIPRFHSGTTLCKRYNTCKVTVSL